MMYFVMDYDREYVIARCDNRVDAQRIAREWTEENGEQAQILTEDEFYN